MTTMLQTLNETVAAYTSKTRAVNPENESCRYFIDGKCCAVGRCMIDPKKYKDFSGNVTRFHALDLLLKPEYRGFPIYFWIELQVLHDSKFNWDEEGLTEEGKKKVAAIIKEYLGL